MTDLLQTCNICFHKFPHEDHICPKCDTSLEQYDQMINRVKLNEINPGEEPFLLIGVVLTLAAIALIAII